MKSRILQRLREAGGFVSGQELCVELGVSRTAVWKVMQQLRAEGYEIEAVQNRGYRLLSRPDLLSEEEIRSRLATRFAGSRIVYYDTLDSTNVRAGKLAEEGALDGTLVVADRQTAGKGRRGRRWETPNGESVAMSLLLRPAIRPERASMLTLVMGMAVAKALDERFGIGCRIKWPNDVVVDGRKVCGILTELSAEMNDINYLVIGCGINANMTEFPEELKDRAVSLRMLTGKEVCRAQVIADCLAQLESYYDRFLKTEDMTLLRAEYNDTLAGLGDRVCVLEPGHTYTGISQGINDRGELLVQKEDGEVVRVYAGEVSVRGIYGYV